MLSDSALSVILPRIVSPYDEDLLNPASYDVTLADTLRMMVPVDEIDVAAVPTGHTQSLGMGPEGYLLEPGDFVLGATREMVDVPSSMVARVEGKSSLGRLGLAVHITAGYIDPGFHGSITLEIANLNTVPVRIRPGMRIGQITLQTVTGEVRHPYGDRGNYQFQPSGTPVESRYAMGMPR